MKPMVALALGLLFYTFMKALYSDLYDTDLGSHVWRTSKYRLVRERLILDGHLRPEQLLAARPATGEEIMAVHTPRYWRALATGTLPQEEAARIEIPVSGDTVRMFQHFAGGTIQAGEMAMQDGLCVHLGGGFHHAFRDRGAGFCMLNDIAIGVQSLLAGEKIRYALIIDCDVHQGDGTARIFQRNPDVFTFSMHQGSLFPMEKQKSSYDVELEDKTGDELYLDRLRRALDYILLPGQRFDFAHYQAGADPYRGDRLGGLDLSVEGLYRRDCMVLDRLTKAGIPVVVTLGGGYAHDLDDLVTIHCNTVRAALASIAR